MNYVFVKTIKFLPIHSLQLKALQEENKIHLVRIKLFFKNGMSEVVCAFTVRNNLFIIFLIYIDVSSTKKYIFILIKIFHPVSYTHLDVYKRQLLV